MALSTLALAESNYEQLPERTKANLNIDAKNGVLSASAVKPRRAISGLRLEASAAAPKVELGKGIFKRLTADGTTSSDTFVFGRATKVRNASINLGADTAADTIEFDRKGSMKGVVISNFGPNDTLKVGGKTFTADDIRPNGRIKGLGGIRFN